MKKMICVTLCAALLAGTAVVSYAQRGPGPGYGYGGPSRGDWRGGIRSRIHDAKRRIDQGLRNGTLTRHEARRLNGKLDRIMFRIDRMRSDGDLSPRERDMINRDLDRLNRQIFREKRDDNRRGDYGGRPYRNY
ncbi:MAG: hypothetical protein PHG20_01415 [Geobacteraceae bacterium]|nr:hypothetical protein [Geobacteraceae bacterium]